MKRMMLFSVLLLGFGFLAMAQETNTLDLDVDGASVSLTYSTAAHSAMQTRVTQKTPMATLSISESFTLGSVGSEAIDNGTGITLRAGTYALGNSGMRQGTPTLVIRTMAGKIVASVPYAVVPDGRGKSVDLVSLDGEQTGFMMIRYDGKQALSATFSLAR